VKDDLDAVACLPHRRRVAQIGLAEVHLFPSVLGI
jgi:hypothetical protein